MITVHRVVHRLIERAAGRQRGRRARPSGPQRLGEQAPRVGGEVPGARARVGEAAARLDQRPQLAPLGRGPALAQGETLEPAPVGLARLPQRRDERQRDLALGQVGAHGLAGHLGIAQVVEEVVHDLEGHPEPLAELAERHPRPGSGRAGPPRRLRAGPAGAAIPVAARPDLGRGPDQRAGLRPDHLRVLLLGHLEVVGVLELERLAARHLGHDPRQHLQRVVEAVADHQPHRVREQVVPHDDGHLVGPQAVDRRQPPAQGAAIHGVVVDERRGVHHLDHGRREHRRLAEPAARAGRQEQQRGTELLAPGGEHVPAHLVQDGDRGPERIAQQALDLLQFAAYRPLDRGEGHVGSSGDGDEAAIRGAAQDTGRSSRVSSTAGRVAACRAQLRQPRQQPLARVAARLLEHLLEQRLQRLPHHRARADTERLHDVAPVHRQVARRAARAQRPARARCAAAAARAGPGSPSSGRCPAGPRCAGRTGPRPRPPPRGAPSGAPPRRSTRAR